MARYVTTVRSQFTPAEAFARMADLSGFAEWDPGVTTARQVRGHGPGPDAEWDLTLAQPPRFRLRYKVREFVDGERVVVEARHPLLTSYDIISVEEAGTGSTVTYDAEVSLRGPLGLFDGMLARSFQQIGDRAAAGLAEYLHEVKETAGP
jgi:hypothetical protein